MTPRTQRRPKNERPAPLPEDLQRLRDKTEAFLRGEISATRYRVVRVPMGIYEQRKAGSYMIRIRLPAGRATPPQLRAMARAAREYGDGRVFGRGEHFEGASPATPLPDDVGEGAAGIDTDD